MEGDEEMKSMWKVVVSVVLVGLVLGYLVGSYFPMFESGEENTLRVMIGELEHEVIILQEEVRILNTSEDVTVQPIRGTVFPYEIFVYDADKVYKARMIFTLEKLILEKHVPYDSLWSSLYASSRYISGAYVILMDENYTVRKFLGNYGTVELGKVYHTRVAEWVDPADVGSNTSAMVSWLGTRGVEISDRPCIHTWDLENNEIRDYVINTHHDYQIINGSIFHFVVHRVEVNGIKQKWDWVVQSDMEGNVLWEYDTSKCINASWSTGPENDPTHLNSLHFDGEKVYVNARNCDTFFVIDYNGGRMLYGVGKYGNFTMLKGAQWHWSHSYVKLNETDFLMFDNLAGKTSRVIHNRLNFDDMTCKLITEWVLPQELFCGHWGKVQQLPNNNILVTAGATRHVKTEDAVGAAILEYTQDGELVMKIQFPLDWGICHGAYKEVKEEK